VLLLPSGPALPIPAELTPRGRLGVSWCVLGRPLPFAAPVVPVFAAGVSAVEQLCKRALQGIPLGSTFLCDVEVACCATAVPEARQSANVTAITSIFMAVSIL
jgi:hypothetical protein